MTKYAMTLKTLSSMDDSQLKEMFYDMEDLAAVQRIADAAYAYLESCEGSDEESEDEDQECHEKSDYEDWKEQDDAQRYRDIQSDNRRPY